MSAELQSTLALENDFDESEVFGDSTIAQYLRSEIQQNYLKVEVYFQTLNVREIREMKKYTVSTREKMSLSNCWYTCYLFWLGCQGNFFFFKLQLQGTVAAIGGSLSLYLGVALILCFELVELFFDVLLALVGNKKRQGSP